MDRVRATLRDVLGEEAVSDFIASALASDDVMDIKRRVSAILDVRKVKNQQVYKILVAEKERRNAFLQEGYRKTYTDPNAPHELIISSNQPKNLSSAEETKCINTISKGKQKTKFYPLFSEGARGGQLVSLLPGRHPCQCLATKHQLVNNCSLCGRIVCTQEGSGPCYFCGHLVCTKEENQAIARGSRPALRLRNRLLQAPWAPGTDTPPYSLKRRPLIEDASNVVKNSDGHNGLQTHCDIAETDGDIDEDLDFSRDLISVDNPQQRMEAGLTAALANRDRLLDYDATSARRTRVLDDEMDYFVTEGSGAAAAWLSPEARERVAQRVAELRAQRHASRLQSTSLCLDFAGRTVKLVDNRDEAARQLYNPTEQEQDELEASTRKFSSEEHSSDHLRQVTFTDRVVDPTLAVRMLKFLPVMHKNGYSVESQSEPTNSVAQALRQPLSEFRLQDENSRQLVDEGFCLSMHQPWASLLIRGIKKDEGRTWYTTHRGCLWIASTSMKPDLDDIREAEDNFLKSGGDRTNLPPSYPTGCLLGRVNVVDVLPLEEYQKRFPDRCTQSPYMFLCDDPRELLLKLPISGKHKIYKLEKHVHLAAKKHLS